MWIPDRMPQDIESLIRALAHLPPEARVTITVSAGDLAYALTEFTGGPEIMGTSQASRFLGYSSEHWRNWAAAGLIPGAWQDEEGKSWRLPKRSCVDRIRELQYPRHRRRPWKERGPYRTAEARRAEREAAGDAPGTLTREEVRDIMHETIEDSIRKRAEREGKTIDEVRADLVRESKEHLARGQAARSRRYPDK